MEAEKNGDWLELTKLSLGGVGKTIGAYLQSGLGITNEEAEVTQNSFAARNYIGTIKDPQQAAKALELGTLYGDELASGKSIVPTGEKPGMAFGTGPLTAKLGMNLAMAENYLRDLENDKSKKLGSASLRNFAIQSGDAFMPFVSIGDIVVDENNFQPFFPEERLTPRLAPLNLLRVTPEIYQSPNVCLLYLARAPSSGWRKASVTNLRIPLMSPWPTTLQPKP